MSWIKPLIKEGSQQLGKAAITFAESMVKGTDQKALTELASNVKTRPEFDKWLGHVENYAGHGEKGALIEMIGIQDAAINSQRNTRMQGNALEAIANKGENPQADSVVHGENPIKNTTTGISAADKKIADEYVASPEGKKYLEEQRLRKEKRLEDQMRYDERNLRPYQRSAAKAGEEIDPLAYKHKGRYDSATEGARREINDAQTTADPKNVEEFFDDPIQAQTGYKKEAGPRNPGRDPALGFKPTNKDLETGATYTDLLSQHHILFNDDAGAMVSQKVFQDDPAFLVAMQRYIAQKYDSALGEAAKNMANLPQNAVHSPYHTWLRKLEIDGIGGKNYEQFWKQKKLENPNMTAQQVQDAVDQWFEEVIYPSVVMLDNFMKKADPKTFSKGEVSFPNKLLKQARASIENDLKKIKPTAEAGTTAYDVQMDDIHTRAQRGEFNERRAWFTDSKARKDAAETL